MRVRGFRVPCGPTCNATGVDFNFGSVKIDVLCILLLSVFSGTVRSSFPVPTVGQCQYWFGGLTVRVPWQT